MTNSPQFIDNLTTNAIPRVRQGESGRHRLLNTHYDTYLLAVVGLLCAIGLLMVYSASIDASFLATEDRSTTYFFRRQLFPNLFVGIIALYIFARIDYRVWRRLSILFMFAIMASLVLVLGVGDDRLEARRALISGSYQPGEAAKLVVVMYMAAWLASKRHRIRDVTYGILPFSIMIGTVSILIILQPDISTAASILATALTMFFLAGASWAQISMVTIGGFAASYFIATQFDYARNRIEGHLAAIENLTLANNHVQAAIVAFLDGGLFGVGLGEGRQKYVIPFPHTDSVFAVIGEELGLIGCSVVIALYIAFVYRGFTVARKAPDAYGALLAAGVTIWLVYDALLNIAVMVALVPPTGVALPFISFGGSSLVSALAGVGLILSVSRVASRYTPEELEALAEVDMTIPIRPKQLDLERALASKPAKREDMVRPAKRRRHHSGERPSRSTLVPTSDFSEVLEATEEQSEQAEIANTVEPTTPETEPTSQEQNDHHDEDSNLGGRDRRGRISRISCR
ncbi:MAG: hypothetical protein CUN55_05365 [Phototrophicales bacterium]|nr:MAG: hypothetical protein CUN55_05365 [Phototrophicales bacterium]